MQPVYHKPFENVFSFRALFRMEGPVVNVSPGCFFRQTVSQFPPPLPRQSDARSTCTSLPDGPGAILMTNPLRYTPGGNHCVALDLQNIVPNQVS